MTWRHELLDPGGAECGAIGHHCTASPMAVAAALSRQAGFAFLDTKTAAGRPGTYSIVAWDPVLALSSKGDRVTIAGLGSTATLRCNPISALEALLEAAWTDCEPPTDVPFAGGAIGYLAFDLYRYIERFEKPSAVDDLRLPDCRLAFHDAVLVYDHDGARWFVAGTTALSGRKDLRALLESKGRELERALARRARVQPSAAHMPGLPVGKPNLHSAPPAVATNMSRELYLESVRRAREHILAGDVYQVNFTQRFDSPLGATAFELFAALRAINPSAYGACLLYPGHAVVSASPELFLFRRGSEIVTRPIKGTRPRGSNAEEDANLRSDLEASAKDAAELSMIVDLSRNDLGRVCEYGSVRLAGHRHMEALPTVFHTSSTVAGRLRDGVGTVELLRAAFPAGSISGCPKIRALQLIDELEPTRRNAYTGAIGYIGFGGDLALNVAIRTMIVKGERAYYQAGGGIVADSDPEAEYEEALDKAVAMRRAVEAVQKGRAGYRVVANGM